MTLTVKLIDSEITSLQKEEPLRGLEGTSLLRRMREIVCKAFDGLRSLWCYCFPTLSLDKEMQASVEAFKKTKVEEEERANLERRWVTEDNVLPAILALQRRTKLGQPSVTAFCQKLSSRFPGSCLIESFLNGNGGRLPCITDNDRILMIPAVITGRVRNHIVAIAFDRNTNMIKVYDSKGLTVMDREARGDRLLSNPSMSLLELVQLIKSTYGNDQTQVERENTDKHQKNVHDCSLFVSKYFEAMLQGKPMTFQDTDTMRIEMIKSLILPPTT